MTPAVPHPRRQGWPWPPAMPSPMHALSEARTLVTTSALAVAELTEALHRALQRLQEAEAEARIAAACVAARDADAVIAKARRAAD